MKKVLDSIVEQLSDVIVGKEHQIRLALTCILARGHLLIEDLPGVGKTTLGHALARALGLAFNRVQFTSDLLPADILGVNIFDRKTSGFTFHKGPIFSQVVLADEINRATPKTQSALLEAMEEQQVTIEGVTYQLPTPFFVIGTQNPIHDVGTFSLPASQLDRFFMSITLGYPNRRAERDILLGKSRKDMLNHMQSTIDTETLMTLQQAAFDVHSSDSLLDYLQSIIEFSRQSTNFVHGLSPRAALILLRCAKAWALLMGRDYVIPEDIQVVLPHVTNHRLKSAENSLSNEKQMSDYFKVIPIA